MDQEKKERMIKALSKRDEVMKGIQRYQEKTGIPSDDEVNTSFLKETIGVEDFSELESEEN